MEAPALEERNNAAWFWDAGQIVWNDDMKFSKMLHFTEVKNGEVVAKQVYDREGDVANCRLTFLLPKMWL